MIDKSRANYSMEILDSALRINFSLHKKNWIAIFLFFFLLVIWGSVLALVVSVTFLVVGEFDVRDLLGLIIPLFLLIVVIRPYLFLFCWHLWGSEEVTITSHQFILKRKVFGLKKSKSFLPERIKNLRFAPYHQNQRIMRAQWTFWQFSGGPLVFDYGNDKYSFGQGITESEATALITKLREKDYFIQ